MQDTELNTKDELNTEEERGTAARPGERVATAPGDIASSLATLITAIRGALVANASPEARAAGATACRTIVAVLDAKPGQPLGASPQPAGTATSPIGTMLSQPGFLTKLAAMSREELLGLLKQVTSSLPRKVPSAPSPGPRFHLIQIPQLRRPDGT